MNEIIEISHVKGYVGGNGVVYLNLEDVAMGLGFIYRFVINGNTYFNVELDNIKACLSDIGFEVKTDNLVEVYIPENVFYQLCDKAKARVSEIFKNDMNNEIIPGIRRTFKGILDSRNLVPDNNNVNSINRSNPISYDNLLKENLRLRRKIEKLKDIINGEDEDLD